MIDHDHFWERLRRDFAEACEFGGAYYGGDPEHPYALSKFPPIVGVELVAANPSGEWRYSVNLGQKGQPWATILVVSSQVVNRIGKEAADGFRGEAHVLVQENSVQMRLVPRSPSLE